MRDVAKTIRLASQLLELSVWAVLAEREKLSKELERRGQQFADQLTPTEVQGVLICAESLLQPYRVKPKKKSKSKSKKKDAEAKD